MKVAYLFTTFPKYSETFLMREIEALARTEDLELELYSFLGGRGPSFAGFPLRHLRWWHWPVALVRGLFLLARHPGRCLGWLKHLYRTPPKSWTNAGEQLLGLAFALSFGKELQKHQTDRIHAAWATAPATAALLLRELYGLPFSMGAHAYDIFRDGGDCFLAEKMRHADFVHTSTESAAEALRARVPDASPHIHVIRRGLDAPATLPPARAPGGPLRLLSVGRLIPKKGYEDLIAVYQALHNEGISFDAKIVGDGPLRTSLLRQLQDAHLTDQVSLLGRLAYSEIEQLYKWADCLLFTGKIAPDGDRDGFPNVVGEAMAHGAVVLSTASSAVPEAIQDGIHGYLLAGNEPKQWARTLRDLQNDPAHTNRLRKNAHAWAIRHFDVTANTARLAELHKTVFTAYLNASKI